MRLLFAVAISFFLFKQAGSQTTFNHRYHFDTPAAYLTSVVPTDSCYYATGIYADLSFGFLQVGSLFVKFDLEGVPVLVKELVHPHKSYETRSHDLTPLPDGTFVVSAYSFDTLFNMTGMLIKYNKEGDTLWTRHYPNPIFPNERLMFPRALAQTPEGGFAIACWIEEANYNSSILLIKTDSTGIIEWQEIYGASELDSPGSIIALQDSSLIIGGVRSNINLVNENYTFQCSILKLSGNGTTQWEYLTPNSIGLRDGANDMVRLEDSSLVIASGIGEEIDVASVNDIYFEKAVIKLDSYHEMEWERTFETVFTSDNHILTNIEALSDNSGFVVAGTSGMDLPGLGTYSLQGWVCKLSPEGDSLWARRYIGVESDNPRHSIFDLREAPDGGFIICGESRDDDADSIRQQAWLLKLDQYGCLIPGCQLPNAGKETDKPMVRLAIYPNPTSDYLNFQLRTLQYDKNGSFRIINKNGNVIKEFNSLSGEATYILPVWDWTNGIYYLQYLVNEEPVHTEKFIKQ